MSDQTNSVHWFEIPVNDLERAKQFYETVFGFQLSFNEMGPMKMAWFPMSPGGGGATGMLMKSEGYAPSHMPGHWSTLP